MFKKLDYKGFELYSGGDNYNQIIRPRVKDGKDLTSNEKKKPKIIDTEEEVSSCCRIT